MKIKITLEPNQTIEEAEKELRKALSAKEDCSGGERYFDKPLNDFHDWICSRHESLTHHIIKEIVKEIESDAHFNHHS